MTGRRAAAVTIVAALAAFGSAMALQVRRDARYPRDDRDARRILYVGSGPAMQRIALSFDALAADVYWIRALQHYGGDRLSGRRQRKYELLYPLLDLTTSLDPYFTIAYRFGAIYLSEAYPGGRGRPDQAVTLLRKGIAAQPTKWQYYHDVGFVHYWQLRDLEAAARWFRLAAAQPTAPNWLEPVSATILAKAGDRASSRFLWQQISRSQEEWLRRAASRALIQLDAMDQIAELEAIIRRVPPPDGQAYSWEGLVRRGVIRGIPLDPSGTPYAIDPSSGALTVSEKSELHPLPTHQPSR